ncbi:MAG TPA: FtsX-like permease family protein [Gemmatimonadales bacterium]|nr:FtsX-like permease family protein [Gemmatimonadales bacterium]
MGDLAKIAFALGLVLAGAPGRPAAQEPLPIAVERRLAAELGLGVGDTLRLGVTPDSIDRLARVAAIYEAAADPSAVPRRELHLRMHLPDLADLLGAPDRVDRFGVALRPGVAPERAAAAINRVAFGFQAHPSAEIAAESSQTFRVVSRFHRAIAVITIAASAVFLLCVMLLKVEERRTDAAAMRLVGVRRRTIFGALLVEASLVAAAGSALGVVIAWAAGGAVNAYYRRYFDTTLVFSAITADIVRFSLALSLVLGLAAGSLAAWRLVRTRPLTLWRRG